MYTPFNKPTTCATCYQSVFDLLHLADDWARQGDIVTSAMLLEAAAELLCAHKTVWSTHAVKEIIIHIAALELKSERFAHALFYRNEELKKGQMNSDFLATRLAVVNAPMYSHILN